MAVQERGFREIDVSVCSVAQIRHPVRPGLEWQLELRPQLWRSNLTALSQYYNLYFYAFWSEIRVYRPHFPSQELQSRPIFSFPLGASGLSLPGYIDETHPHAVNQIMVGDLGQEEILVCVCDDGDVIAYTTRSIEYAVEKQSAYQGSTEADLSYVKAFFIGNVEKSAWGIAIHKEARLLAVSANTHNITVFAFALDTASSKADASSENDGHTSKDNPMMTYCKSGRSGHIASPPHRPPDRSVSRKIELCGHYSNIPNIAFCNTENDKEGKYLASVDIDGRIIVWNMWRQERLMSSYLKHIPQDRPMSRSSRPVGWNILCPDIRAFRPVDTEVQLFGCRVRREFSGYDIGASRRDVKDSSAVHPLLRQAERDLVGAPEDTLQDEEDFDAYTRETDEEDLDDDMLTDMAMLTEDFVSEYQNPTSSDTTTSEDRSANASRGFVSASDSRPINTRPHTSPFQHTTTSASDVRAHFPFFILCMTDTDLVLRESGSDLPETFLGRALVQELPPEFSGLSQFERLNMAVQIPELGVVIVASQVGRVALLTLTTRRGSKKSRDQHAFRLDWILPFKSQEDHDLRPGGPLHGIAVSPIQGQQSRMNEDNDNVYGRPRIKSWRAVEPSRRYRLMLTYYDRSVLSYEIGRTSEETNTGELLVF